MIQCALKMKWKGESSHARDLFKKKNQKPYENIFKVQRLSHFYFYIAMELVEQFILLGRLIT